MKSKNCWMSEETGAFGLPPVEKLGAIADFTLWPGERMDEIGFGGLYLIQEPSSFCYGIDAVLLADFASRYVKAADRVCDLGTGTGVIPLILSRKTDAECLVGVELQPDSAKRAERNVMRNQLSHRIEIVCADVACIGSRDEREDLEAALKSAFDSGTELPLKSAFDSGSELPLKSAFDSGRELPLKSAFDSGSELPLKSAFDSGRELPLKSAFDSGSELPWETSSESEGSAGFLQQAAFDLVVSNPPYMRRGSGLLNSVDAKTVARHETRAELSHFIRAAAYLLKERGSLCMIHRPNRLVDLFVLCRENGLEPKELQMISPRADREPNLALVRCGKGGRPDLKVLESLWVYDSSGKRTERVLQMYECPGS